MAAAGFMAAGGGLKAYSALRQGNAEYQAQEMNAQVNEQNAALAESQALEDERKQRLMTKKLIGSMRANYGASGVTLEGSPMEVIEESAMQAELDALNIKHAGKARATQYRNQAALARYYGKEARTLGYLGAAGSLLGGAGDAFGTMGKRG